MRRQTAANIVAVERHGENSLRIYRRENTTVRAEVVAFEPWMLVPSPAIDQIKATASVTRLDGDAPLSHIVTFESWSAWRHARQTLRDSQLPMLTFVAPAEQYFVRCGGGMFDGMVYSDLIRVQLDIETSGLDPAAPDAEIVIITATVNGHDALMLRGDQLSEGEMLNVLSEWIRDHDPDIIEGHNVFNFDLPYLSARAQRLNHALRWGRDGSSLRIGNEQRFKAGARTIPYQSAFVYGRHIIDTYQQIQRYDVSGSLGSYALKPAIRALGLERSDRTHIDRDAIVEAWTNDRMSLLRYAVDDVYDVNSLSELTVPTEFYQCSVVPGALQAVATGGPGEKINDMLVREYVIAGSSIPLPQTPRGYPGGHTELRRTGVFKPIVKCDVESLYPSIMLTDRIEPAQDHLGVFLPMLDKLTQQRLEAKRTVDTTTGAERALWVGMQSSLKVLINSFYGYLGYSRGYFNDYVAAERVTLRGQAIIQHIVKRLEQRGAAAIEVDTDGVLFTPPAGITSKHEEMAFVDEIAATLPERIRLAHDGRFRAMLSLRLKNYALMTYEFDIVLKGSSLRSRRDEPLLRTFLVDAVPRLLEPDRFGDPRELYLNVASRIQSGSLSGDEIARTETITEQTFTSASNFRIAAAVAGERIGERVTLYQRSDGSLARSTAFADDADRRYLLRRLHEIAMRFQPVFTTMEEFGYIFPSVTLETDIAMLRKTPRTTQLSLFG